MDWPEAVVHSRKAQFFRAAWMSLQFFHTVVKAAIIVFLPRIPLVREVDFPFVWPNRPVEIVVLLLAYENVINQSYDAGEKTATFAMGTSSKTSIYLLIVVRTQYR